MKNTDSLLYLLALGLEDGSDNLGELDFSDIPDGDWRLGGYELLEEIGRGGMGIIYKARQPHSNRLVALKRLRPIEGTEMGGMATAARLHREAEAVASLDHPHILPIYEVGMGNDGLPFFSMKLAAGGSLAEVSKPVEKRKAVQWMLKVARAVQYAHGEGILHRDLKPANILLDAQGEPLVADFGLAKWLDRPSELTQTLTVLGTPGYLAPEQALGMKVGFATDIYSMGAIFFELLTGRPPFVGSNAWSVVKEASEKPAPRLRELLPGADLDLETICSRCLEREMDARYRAAGDLGDDLQRWLDGRPIIARPVSLAERGLRWTRRNRLLSILGISVLVFAGGVVVKERENAQLATEVRVREQISQAVAVLPILDLDEMSVSSPVSDQANKFLGNSVKELGRAFQPPISKKLWERNFAEQARNLNAPYLLVGTTRHSKSGQRFALHYFDTREGRFTRQKQGTFPIEQMQPKLAELAAEILAENNHAGETASETNPVQSEVEKNLLDMGEQYYYQFTATSLDQSISCLKKAVEINPQSVAGHTLLAVSLIYRSRMGVANQLDYEQSAKDAVSQALALAPDNPKVYRAKASVAFISGRLEEAQEATRSYIELSMDIENSAGTNGAIERLKGHPIQAMRWFEMGNSFIQHPEFLTQQADLLTDFEIDKEANAIYQKFTDIFPHKVDGKLGMCVNSLLRKDFPAAHDAAEKLTKEYPDESYSPLILAMDAFCSRNFVQASELYANLAKTNRKGGAFFYGSISYLSGEGFSLLQTGHQEEGTALLFEARKSEMDCLGIEKTNQDHLYSLAAIEAALGNKTSAIQILEDNLNVLFTNHRFIALDPRFDSLRDSPQFQEILLSMARRVALLRQQILEENSITKN